jgi:membrane-bound inhibitor of C-type lysozyme
MQSKWNLLMIAALGWSALAGATDLTIHLTGSQPISQKTVPYQCDGQAAATGLPGGAFLVQYMNGAGNSLVIVPVNGASLIFTNVTSASGARYAAGQYIWWEAAGSVNFYSDSLAGKNQTACHRVDAK